MQSPLPAAQCRYPLPAALLKALPARLLTARQRGTARRLVSGQLVTAHWSGGQGGMHARPP